MRRLLLPTALVSTLVFATTTDSPFTSYAGARQLCSEHVMGSGMEIHWQSFASADPPAKVIAFFEAALKQKGKPDAGGHGVEWRSARNPDESFTVFATGEAASYPSCAQKPSPSEKTVLFYSTAFRFGKR